jgi:hypothetical protein
MIVMSGSYWLVLITEKNLMALSLAAPVASVGYLLPCDNPDGVNDSWNVSKKGEEDIQPEVNSESYL